MRQDERLALQVDLEGDSARLESAGVVFEIASAKDSAAIVQVPATMSRGARDGWLLAQSVADVRLLPPGPYVVRARVTSAGAEVGEVRRAFEVLETPRAAAASVDAPPITVGSGGPPAPSSRRTLPPFALEQVLNAQVLGAFLDKVAARPDAAAPPIRALLDRARSEPLEGLEIPETLAADAPVAAFLKGLSLLAEEARASGGRFRAR